MSDLSAWTSDVDLLLAASGLSQSEVNTDLLSAQHVAVSAYLAVEESWPEVNEREVLDACSRHVAHEAPSVAAAVAVRAAILDTWWVRDASDPRAWDRAIAWGESAVTLMPEWLSGWLVLADGFAYRGEWGAATSAARRTFLISPPHLETDLDTALEILFAGRLGWTRTRAEELMHRIRAQEEGRSI